MPQTHTLNGTYVKHIMMIFFVGKTRVTPARPGESQARQRPPSIPKEDSGRTTRGGLPGRLLRGLPREDYPRRLLERTTRRHYPFIRYYHRDHYPLRTTRKGSPPGDYSPGPLNPQGVGSNQPLVTNTSAEPGSSPGPRLTSPHIAQS